MEDLKQQLIKAVESLPDEPKRSALISKINSSELNQELIDEVGSAVREALDYYEQSVVKALTEADEQVEEVLSDYNKQLKVLQKQESAETDQKNIEELRKKISQE